MRKASSTITERSVRARLSKIDDLPANEQHQLVSDLLRDISRLDSDSYLSPWVTDVLNTIIEWQTFRAALPAPVPDPYVHSERLGVSTVECWTLRISSSRGDRVQYRHIDCSKPNDRWQRTRESSRSRDGSWRKCFYCHEFLDYNGESAWRHSLTSDGDTKFIQSKSPGYAALRTTRRGS